MGKMLVMSILTLMSSLSWAAAPASDYEYYADGSEGYYSTDYRTNIPQHKTCVARFNQRLQQKMAAGVPKKHLPRLYLPAYNPKRTVVIFTHGIFESPYFFKGVNQLFREQGHVSLSILLPGHWQGDWSSMKKVKYQDWINEVKENVAIAQCFGDKIIFAGHSLGGILSINAALQFPQQTAGVMLWSPALDMRTLPTIGGFLGGLLHINGNIVMKSANLDEQPLFAPNAAKQVGGIIKHVRKTYGNGKMKNIYPQLTAPTFLVYAQRDPAVDVDDITVAAHSIKGLQKQDVMYFPEDTGVWHGNVTKSRIDAYKKARWDFNQKWEPMKANILRFLRANY